MKCKAVFIILTIIFAVSCKQQTEIRTEPENTVYVKVRLAEWNEFNVPVRLSGLLGTRQEMKLSFKTGGLINRVNVRDGESVRKEQVLMSLDLVEINANVRQAEIALDKAKRDVLRVQNLYEDSVATLEQYQNASSAYGLALAQKRIADFNLSHSTIRAPSNGKIQKVLVEANEMIAPGYPAILFASTENEWVVRVAVTDKDIVRLAIGDSAIVTMDAFPELTFSAVIAELGAIADPVTGTYEAELQIKDPDHRFRTGFICRTQVFPDETFRGIPLPPDAILETSSREGYVYLIKNNVPVKVKVNTGPVSGGFVMILKGISEGDSVIIEGAHYIGQGSNLIITE